MRVARPHSRFPDPNIEMSPILSLAVSALYIHKANKKTMSTENFIITKRDGSEEPFCIDKIKNAIMKACAASGDQLDAEALERIMSHLHFCNGMNVENIQNQVEVALMKEEHYNAAKTFIVDLPCGGCDRR